MDWKTRRAMLLGLKLPVFAPADENGGDGGEGDQGGDQGSDGGDEGGEGGQNRSSILDFRPQDGDNDGGDQGQGDAWKLPEGMELPEHLVGTDAEDTLAKVSKAYKGARQQLSTRGDGKLEGAVPDNPDGYTFEAEGENDAIAAELNSEDSKPYVDAFRKAAHKLGIPDKAFTQLMREGLGGIQEAGVDLGMSTEEAQQINGKAEMKALSDEVGEAEAGTIINTLGVYGDKLVDRGVLADENDVAEFSQMVGTARAARIFHRILTGELGEKPVPPGDGVDGAVTSHEAYAKHAEASKMPPGAEKDAAMAEAQRLMSKAFGGNNAGSVRSNVL